MARSTPFLFLLLALISDGVFRVHAEAIDAERYAVEGDAAKQNGILIYQGGKNHDLYRIYLKGHAGEGDIDKSGTDGELRLVPGTGIAESRSVQVGKYVFVQIRSGRHKDQMYVWAVDVENRLAATKKPEMAEVRENNGISIKLELAPGGQVVIATLTVHNDPAKTIRFNGLTGERYP